VHVGGPVLCPAGGVYGSPRKAVHGLKAHLMPLCVLCLHCCMQSSVALLRPLAKFDSCMSPSWEGLENSGISPYPAVAGVINDIVGQSGLVELFSNPLK